MTSIRSNLSRRERRNYTIRATTKPWTRTWRRAISRDEARANPIPARPRTHGDRVNTPTPLAIRPPSARSGQQRIDAKRNARAHFWRTIPIRIWAQVDDDAQGRLLTLFPRGSRIHGCTPMENSLAFALDMHIPGMPAKAIRGETVFHPAVPGRDYWLPRLHRIDYYDAHGQICTEHEAP